ncbi:SDR family oxidoreductase [Massilia sp. IC2-477]|uniref:SDR family oxidoreductase n=1 Tax=Massilia sp. IC2-477 TaxID=2887198 RepID=UPI001D120969|nr:SDR family oxidoreductase [Massilia sp. IC2-477]MCC2957797.1 SDR family oxidoreductase [Massilia sp. IC2-477]
MPTILITGCSSGFGLETARHFLERGWEVVATMRTPRADLLPASPRLRIIPLDVSDEASIRHAVGLAGQVDVLVNNAGIGLLGVFETTPLATLRELFDTNVLGAMAMAQAMLPQFRERGAGVIINVSSSTTLLPLPLLAAYTASKAAMNAWTESLALELQPIGVRAHVVLPGRSPETTFARNAAPRMQGSVPDAYAGFVEGVFAGRGGDGPVTYAADVVEAIWRAALDPAAPLRIPAGADAVALA